MIAFLKPHRDKPRNRIVLTPSLKLLQYAYSAISGALLIKVIHPCHELIFPQLSAESSFFHPTQVPFSVQTLYLSDSQTRCSSHWENFEMHKCLGPPPETNKATIPEEAIKEGISVILKLLRISVCREV